MWQPTPVFLPEKSHGKRSLEDYSPKGHKKSDMTEQLTTSTCALTHSHTHTHTYTFSVFSPYRLLKNIEYSSLCNIVGPCYNAVNVFWPVMKTDDIKEWQETIVNLDDEPRAPAGLGWSRYLGMVSLLWQMDPSQVIWYAALYLATAVSLKYHQE